MSIEVMKQALETLESLQGGCTDNNDGTVEAITVWCPEIIDDLRVAIEASEKQKTTIEDNSKNWAGMDGAIAWHLIKRHADNWADVGKMMDEWLAANTKPAIKSDEPQEPVAGKPEGGWQNTKYPHNFGKPMGYAIVTNADRRLPFMLDGGCYTFRSEAEKVLKRPEYTSTHHIVELIANATPSAAPEQEPVAFRFPEPDIPVTQHVDKCLWARNGNTPCPHVPVAAERQWVGLTQPEIIEGFCATPLEVQFVTGFEQGACWAEAKLREKNGGEE